MDEPNDSPLDIRLAALPAADVDPAEAEQVRRRSQRILAREVELRDRPAARAFDRYWVRRLEPALLATFTGDLRVVNGGIRRDDSGKLMRLHQPDDFVNGSPFQIRRNLQKQRQVCFIGGLDGR